MGPAGKGSEISGWGNGNNHATGLAGALHIFIFAGFLVLAIRAFSVLIVGVSQNFVMPGLSGRAGHIYDIITDYAATIVFLCMVIAMIRRVVFKPARYAVPARYGKSHTADAIFLLSLIATLDAGRQSLCSR